MEFVQIDNNGKRSIVLIGRFIARLIFALFCGIFHGLLCGAIGYIIGLAICAIFPSTIGIIIVVSASILVGFIYGFIEALKD